MSYRSRRPRRTSYRWLLSAPDMTVEPEGRGGFVVKDAAGDVRFTIPAPFMWDSSAVVGESEDEIAPVSAQMEPYGSDWLLTLTPDQSWLAAPERVYPVSVDPSVWLGPTYAWSYRSNGTFVDNSTYIGNQWTSDHSLYWRSYARYPLQNIAGSYAVDSVLGFSYASGTSACQWEWVGYTGTTNPTSVSSYGSDVSSFTMCGGGNPVYASDATIDTLDGTVREHGPYRTLLRLLELPRVRRGERGVQLQVDVQLAVRRLLRLPHAADRDGTDPRSAARCRRGPPRCRRQRPRQPAG